MSKVNSRIRAHLGRWILALVTCVTGLLPAFVALELSPVLGERFMRVADTSRVHVPAEISLSLFSLFNVSSAIEQFLGRTLS
jgi:hypothetical protein